MSQPPRPCRVLPSSIVAHARPCHGAMSWPSHGCVVALPGLIIGPCCVPLRACALACHDTIHCIVTQGWKMGNSPSSFLALFFFSLISFFLYLFTYWKTPQNYYFFSFSSSTKNVYFILFYFPVLHTVKPRKKNPQHTIFFYSFSSLPCYSHRCSSLNIAIYITQNFQSLILTLFLVQKLE